MLYRHSSTFCIFALIFVAAAALWITSFIFSSSIPLSAIRQLGLHHYDHGGEVKASSGLVVSYPTVTPFASVEDGDGGGEGDGLLGSVGGEGDEKGEEGAEAPLRFVAFDVGEDDGGDEEEEEDDEGDERRESSDPDRFAAQETMGRDGVGSAPSLRVEWRTDSFGTALSTGIPTASVPDSLGSHAIETVPPLQQPSTSESTHERLRLPERAPLKARADQGVSVEKIMLEDVSTEGKETGDLEKSFGSDATREVLGTGDEEGTVISDPFGYDDATLDVEENSMVAPRHTYRSPTSSSQAREPSSTPRAPNSYQPALIAQAGFSDPYPLPHAYRQLHEHVGCMSGCIEAYGPRCLDGMLGCICTYLPSTTAANLTACVRFTCPSTPPPSLDSDSMPAGDLHEGLKLVLMESAGECWKYGYWIVPKPDELVMSPEEREGLKRKKEKEKEGKKKKEKEKEKERVGLVKKSADVNDWNEEDENPQHRNGEGGGDDNDDDGEGGGSVVVVGSGGHGVGGQDGDGDGDEDDHEDDNSDRDGDRNNRGNELDNTATPAHTIGPGGTIVSPKQQQQQGQGQVRTSGSKSNWLVGQISGSDGGLMGRMGVAVAVTMIFTAMLAV